MKAFNRIATVFVLMTGAAGLSFAAGVPEASLSLVQMTIPDQTTIGTVEVPVTQEIRDWFTNTKFDFTSLNYRLPNGDKVGGMAIDGSKIDAPLASLPETYKQSIDAIVNAPDQRDSLEALIRPALKAALVPGSVEQATMRIGRHLWTLSLNDANDVGY